MSACEKCWADACWQARLTGRSTVEVYRELLRVRDCGNDEAGGDQ